MQALDQKKYELNELKMRQVQVTNVVEHVVACLHRITPLVRDKQG